MQILNGTVFPSIGDTMIYKGVPKFFYPNFTNMAEDAEKLLEKGKSYEISKVEILSSWCCIWLKDFPDQRGFNRSFFEYSLQDQGALEQLLFINNLMHRAEKLINENYKDQNLTQALLYKINIDLLNLCLLTPFTIVATLDEEKQIQLKLYSNPNDYHRNAIEQIVFTNHTDERYRHIKNAEYVKHITPQQKQL